MREQGRIVEWQDDRGFGFVEPHEGGPRAFAHVSAFGGRRRRPVEGDLVTYASQRDPKGRLQARDIRLVAERARSKARVRPRSTLRSFELYCLLVFALFLGAPVFSGHLHAAVPALYMIASVLAYGAYALDKSAAQSNAWRTPESTLHTLALIGGWPGALLAQQRLRHKSRKAAFQRVFWTTVVLNLLVLAWLFTDSGGRVVDALVSEFLWL